MCVCVKKEGGGVCVPPPSHNDIQYCTLGIVTSVSFEIFDNGFVMALMSDLRLI